MNFFKNSKIARQIKPLEAIRANAYTAPDKVHTEIDYFTPEELKAATGERLAFDLEVYPNYFLAAFKSIDSGKCLVFEMSPDCQLDKPLLRWLFDKFLVVSFNGIKFDAPLIWMALETACSAFDLQMACNLLIEGAQPREVEKQYKFRTGEMNHIDLIEVAPLSASLKIYSGRMHQKRMQDLPYEPGVALTQEQALEVRYYCFNDLDCTISLYLELIDQIKLREEMSIDYKLDLRSKSDAQIAEHVISSEIKTISGFTPKRPNIDPETIIQYKVPEFISFQSEQLQNALNIVSNAKFKLNGAGSPMMPPELGDLKIKIGTTVYKMGMGGLHSTEKSVSHFADEDTMLCDVDVASYYPWIILILGLFPQHIGEAFLAIYGKIVTSRLEAKKAGNKKVADSLKITINGGFGKFGSMWSKLYAPDLMLQVTLTGQLAILMLIEYLESIEIPIVSGNTDGIVVKCKKDRKKDLEEAVKMWERHTGFTMEYTNYKSTHSRDVNNYIAIDENGKVKAKGVYSAVGSALNSRLSKNPETLICSDAVKKFLSDKTPIEETIRECLDITRFIAVRTVKGGGIKDGVYLGKAVRWYYKQDEYGTINYKLSGNKVPKSDGAWPLMDLPETLPTDIDYDWYINEANEMLIDIGYYSNQIESLF